MSAKVEQIEKNVVQLEIEVDADKFEESLQQAYQKNRNRFAIPGFRKGKAPRNLVERYYGEQVFYEDAINFACPGAYDKAVEENDIHPVERPEIDIVQIGKGKSFIFKAKVTVKPEVELGEYKGLEYESQEINITEDDIKKELESVADRNARMITVEDRPVENGDILNIDFKGYVDDEQFEGGTAEGHTLVIGSNSFIPGFEDQLIGAELNSEVDVNVTFPEEYHSEELKGKPALFKVKINEIKHKELPEIDDEFAQDVSEFDTLDEYKEDIKNKLIEQAGLKAKRQIEDTVIQKAVENSTIDVPDVMVETQIDNMMREFDMRMRYQGMDLKRYMEMMGMNETQLREQYKDTALNEVKTQLVLEAISKAESIQASDEEIEEEIKSVAASYNQEVEKFKETLRDEDKDYFKNSLIVKNTVKFLVDNAKEK